MPIDKWPGKDLLSATMQMKIQQCGKTCSFTKAGNRAVTCKSIFRIKAATYSKSVSLIQE
jgi:hypothetical protein